MRHPYAEFINSVAKPARYLGGEYQSIQKDLSAVDVSMVLAFPDIYDIGMSHLGTKILYTLLNRDPRIACERCFAPWIDLESELRTRNVPLVSLESARRLAEFDVVGFSLQYELTYSNVLMMLDLGGIALRAADREDDAPLVIAGGPSATHVEPLAPFLDAVLIGDGEERLPQMLLTWKASRQSGVSRQDSLVELAKLGGVYVPSLYATEIDQRTGFEVVGKPLREGVPERVSRAFVEDINRFPFPDDAPVPAAEAVFDRMGIEIARGCTEGCRFCQAGMIYRPVRERDPESIVKSVLGAVDKGGYDEVSLTALSTADVSCIAPLVHEVSNRLTERKVSMSVSSLRAYGLPGEVLDDISRVRAAGLTFAPEAGTQRMRDVICKNITDEDMKQTAHRVFSRGWAKAKLYFMIGLPTELDEDVRGIVDTGANVSDVALQYHKKGRVDVVVSVSSHVPKPHTPFQWAAMDSIDELRRKQGLLRGWARDERIKLKLHEPYGSFLEGVFGRGDRRLAAVLEHAYRAGCRFDGWDEQLKFGVWQEAFQACGVDPTLYLGTIPVDGRLPWDHLDVGLADGFLLKEYRKALKGRLSPPCGKPFQAQVHHTNLDDARAETKKLVCYDCGVACDLDRMREERIEFLQVLGAERRREPAPEIAPGALEQRGKRHRVPPRKFEQGEARRYRLQYRKLGRMSFTGHLDVVRQLPRILRRAGLEMIYSQGFHPHPVMSFGPALGLGITSLSEYCDVQLVDDLAPIELLRRLQAAAPPGLPFVGVKKLRTGDAALQECLTLADYLVGVPAGAATTSVDPDDTLRVERKGKQRVLRLGDLVKEMVSLPVAAAPAEVEVEGESCVLLRLALDGGAKPVEVARHVLGGVEPAGIARVGLWGAALEDPLGGGALDLLRAQGEGLPAVNRPPGGSTAVVEGAAAIAP